MGRYHRRVDANHRALLDELIEVGFAVADTHALGGGFPDAVLNLGGMTWLLEVKPNSKAKLSPAETRFHHAWGLPIIVASTTDEVLAQAQQILGDLLPHLNGTLQDVQDMITERNGGQDGTFHASAQHHAAGVQPTQGGWGTTAVASGHLRRAAVLGEDDGGDAVGGVAPGAGLERDVLQEDGDQAGRVPEHDGAPPAVAGDGH